MDITILLTAVVVSIDAMAAGFALAMRGIMTPRHIFVIGGITLCLCIPASIGGSFLESLLQDYVAFVGGAILILIGTRNLAGALYKPVRTPAIDGKSGDVAGVGFAVGLDAAVANLSISVMGNHSLWVPLIFAAMHIVAVSVGYIALCLIKKGKALECLSALLLIGLGIYKAVGFFM